jgi:hypothetical protein
VMAKSRQDLDPDPDPVCLPWIRIWIRIEVKSWAWIRIRIETNADSNHWFPGYSRCRIRIRTNFTDPGGPISFGNGPEHYFFSIVF